MDWLGIPAIFAGLGVLLYLNQLGEARVIEAEARLLEAENAATSHAGTNGREDDRV